MTNGLFAVNLQKNRHYMKKAFLILFIYCGLMSTAWSQQNLNFKTLDVKGGLADNYVRDITRDSYGFM